MSVGAPDRFAGPLSASPAPGPGEPWARGGPTPWASSAAAATTPGSMAASMPHATTPGTPSAARFVAPPPELHAGVRVLRRSKLKLLLVVVLIAALAAGGGFAYLHFANQKDTAAEMAAYVHGAGVVDAPRGEGYHARLPRTPTTDVVKSTKGTVLVHKSRINVDKYQIEVVSYAVAPSATPQALDSSMRLLLVSWAGTATKITQVTHAVDHGRPALNAVGHRPDAYPVRVHVVFGGHHVILLAVHVESSSTDVYRSLVDSLKIDK